MAEKTPQPDDPVKLKVKSVQVGPGEKMPEVLHVSFENKPYTIPTDPKTEMDGTLPRRGAEFLKAQAARRWSMKVELEILEPTFK